MPVDTGIGQEQIKTYWESVLAAHDGRTIERILITLTPTTSGLATAWLSARCGADLWMTQGEFLADKRSGTNSRGTAFPTCWRSSAATASTSRAARHSPAAGTLPQGYPRCRSATIASSMATRSGSMARNWRVMVGLGHSPEHASFYCEALGVLISGICCCRGFRQTSASMRPRRTMIPLRRFLDSLQRNKVLPDDTLVLPSHGKPFRGIAARAPSVDHHAARCGRTACRVH